VDPEVKAAHVEGDELSAAWVISMSWELQ